MSKRDKNPNRLLDAQAVMLHKEPLLGALVMSTDEGAIDVAINRNVAEMLLTEIEAFLHGDAPTLDELQRPVAANDA